MLPDATELPARPLEILLVEDFEPDVLLARIALEESPVASHMQVAWDGQDALNLMQANGGPPDLILLDLHMPRMDGLQLLDALHTEAALASIPVVVLTTSASDLGLLGARQSWVQLYLEKPLNARDVTRVFQTLFGLTGPASGG